MDDIWVVELVTVINVITLPTKKKYTISEPFVLKEEILQTFTNKMIELYSLHKHKSRLLRLQSKILCLIIIT